MTIFHIVLFKFKASLSPEEVQTACNDMIALGEKCLHPTTGERYVKTLGGGKENSPEGIQDGITHVFVSKFETEEDRKHYIEKDPAHLAFIGSVKDKVDKVQVVDFTPGVF